MGTGSLFLLAVPSAHPRWLFHSRWPAPSMRCDALTNCLATLSEEPS